MTLNKSLFYRLISTPKKLNNLVDIIEQRVQTLQWKNIVLQARIDTLKCHANMELNPLRDDVHDLQLKVNKLMITLVSPDHEDRSQFTAFACGDDMMTLSCPGNRWIAITKAVYAKYENPDSACSGCRCPPNPALDCTELIEENHPKAWNDINSCDQLKVCDVRPTRTVINQCETNYTADYVQVFYECLQDDVTGPVGFTAYADTGKKTTYNYNDVIVFDDVISNYGGHYNPKTSSFVCPADGVYMISVHVLARKSEDVVADIMQNRDKLVGVQLDGLKRQYDGDGGTIVVQGSRGDVMWIRQGYNATGRIYAADRRAFFTCYLLHRL